MQEAFDLLHLLTARRRATSSSEFAAGLVDEELLVEETLAHRAGESAFEAHLGLLEST